MTHRDARSTAVASHVANALQRLQVDHPGWKIWLSRDQRMACATLHDPAVGIDPTLVEDNLTLLRQALERQRQRAERRAEV